MGKIAFILRYFLCSLPNDVYENRLHLHIVLQKKRDKEILAKIWLEKNGFKCIEFESYDKRLDSDTRKLIIDFIDKNYNILVKSIKDSFKGIKVKILK